MCVCICTYLKYCILPGEDKVCEQLSTSGGGGRELTTVEQERRLKLNCLSTSQLFMKFFSGMYVDSI